MRPADKKAVCSLVWEGASNPAAAGAVAAAKKKVFEKWRLVDIRSDAEAKRVLNEKNMGHLWQMVTSFNPDRANGEVPDDLAKML